MAKKLQWTAQYLQEVWRTHHAELIAVVTTIAFWVADFRSSTTAPSLWAWGAVAVLGAYLVYIFRDARETTNAVFGVVEVPYSIVTHKSIEEADLYVASHLRVLTHQDLPVTRVFQRFLISPTDWRYFDQNKVQDGRWRDLVQNIRDHFIRLSKRVTAEARFHLFFVTPPTVALALGATIGRDIRCKAYQYFGPGGFGSVFDPESGGPTDSYHRLQGLVGERCEIRVDVSGDVAAPHVAVILQLVGHPLSPVSGAISDPHCILTVSHVTHAGHLPPTQDWMRIATECGSVVLEQVSAGKTVHLFAGVPTALAFALGHILGDHNPIRVYHYEKQQDKYICVFSLNQIM